VYAALTWIGAQPPQSPDTAAEAVRLLVAEPSAIRVLDTGRAAGLRMLDFAKRYALTGRRVHDARHAATALESGVRSVRFRVDLKRSSGKISSCGKSLQVPFSGFSYSLVR